jgi:hypothetical protein
MLFQPFVFLTKKINNIVFFLLWAYWLKFFKKRVVRSTLRRCQYLYYYQWVDTSASEILVPEGIILSITVIMSMPFGFLAP